MADNTARAKQFMPFAALRGYYAMVLAKNRVVEPPRELIGDATERLSRKLALRNNWLYAVIYKNTVFCCFRVVIRPYSKKRYSVSTGVYLLDTLTDTF